MLNPYLPAITIHEDSALTLIDIDKNKACRDQCIKLISHKLTGSLAYLRGHVSRGEQDQSICFEFF